MRQFKSVEFVLFVNLVFKSILNYPVASCKHRNFSLHDIPLNFKKIFCSFNEIVYRPNYCKIASSAGLDKIGFAKKAEYK